ncbi:hypothetical protein [Aureimonas sp. ME7]|uniref:spike base protein, RCAP_Rcc01079 family n=1 Tax=Aureimonas sp. ME7 TaxID=2744252 RepID=UPI0015F5EE40|nr:hypothetical protein [Aureimonas sp. ME7]
MPARDTYLSTATSMAGPANRLFAVTPDDGADLPFVTTGLYVGGGGDLAVKDRESDATVVFRNLGSGAGLPIRVARVLATGTTATDIVGLA